ncbi:hypothetical protein [Pseudomarimonas arenosa]|uniref:Uncharacterized protein n=1 Tax=Pseudomarimonas arenosa TaxID=2774145 RepID=A0AAW3ZPC4_9GAMM|nr:hypothetical protein [Pseudomarimonas arenosa]MBD8528033.1 hypothetical protein [Pseudomarimonas arenosa]
MRELSLRELELVAGGTFLASDSECGNGNGNMAGAWDALRSGLSAIATMAGGWLGQYIEGFLDTINAAERTGCDIQAYNDWRDCVIDSMSNGGDGSECGPPPGG